MKLELTDKQGAILGALLARAKSRLDCISIAEQCGADDGDTEQDAEIDRVFLTLVDSAEEIGINMEIGRRWH